jgi:pimeloyl-ACP methyl ester carboxylesterase
MIPVAHGREAAELIPHARLEVFERAGHFPHLDDPDRFATVLREFVAGLRPRIVPENDATAS